MEKEIAITNTNTLLFISKINIFLLAKNLFKEIRVTKDVREEIFSKDNPENLIITNNLSEGFLKEVEIKEIKNLSLGIGEASAISYCLENNIRTFLSDDKKAREIAESLGLKVKGVLGIILWNLQNKRISKERAETLLKELKDNDYYFSADLYGGLLDLIRNN